MVSVAKDVSQVLEFKTSGWSDRGYPNSLLGVIAVMRQTFLDAEWYLRSLEIFEKYPEENELIPLNPSLSELGRYHANRLPILFMTKEEHSALRSLKIAEEFNLNPWLLGSGYEYRRLKEIAEFNPFIIFPLDFPNKPKVNDPHIALQFSNEQLKHWDMAPDNIKKVFDADLRFSFTSGTLKNKKDFRKNLQKITDRGLSQDIALAALTTYPAEAMGVNKTVGKIQPGYVANLVVTDGNYFDSRSRVTSIWLAGKEKYISERHKPIIAGKWELEIKGNSYDMEFFIPNTYTKTKELRQKALATNKLEGKIKIGDETLNLIDVRISNKVIEFKVKGTLLDVDAMLAFKGEVKKDKFRGEVYDGSKKGLSFNAKRTVTMKPIVREKEMASSTVLYQPEGAYGLDKDLLSPNAILIDNANIWTCGPKGIVEEWDILFVNGKVDKIAPDISVPMGSALVIDGLGKYVTPGLIDCHSHSAASSINEGAQAVTAEVRIRDVLFADDVNIYRQLGGGLTTANVLHLSLIHI